jgi:hypothetical protein
MFNEMNLMYLSSSPSPLPHSSSSQEKTESASDGKEQPAPLRKKDYLRILRIEEFIMKNKMREGEFVRDARSKRKAAATKPTRQKKDSNGITIRTTDDDIVVLLKKLTKEKENADGNTIVLREKGLVTLMSRATKELGQWEKVLELFRAIKERREPKLSVYIYNAALAACSQGEEYAGK